MERALCAIMGPEEPFDVVGRPNSEMDDPLRENIVAVRAAIARAAERAGRDAREVALVLVTKTVPASRIREALAAGERLFGENRAQELVAKAAELAAGDGSDSATEDGQISGSSPSSSARPKPEWHFIGHLQTNKAKYVARIASMIQSLDSIELARELEKRLQREGRGMDALVEVNISGEATKSGIAPEEALPFIKRVTAECDALRVRGLMTIGPLTEDAAAIRHAFRRMRRLWEELREEAVARATMEVLSMGMSADFPIAIEEGATMVRIGSAIFGPRGHTSL